MHGVLTTMCTRLTPIQNVRKLALDVRACARVRHLCHDQRVHVCVMRDDQLPTRGFAMGKGQRRDLSFLLPGVCVLAVMFA